jgi:hypothetical protein
MCSCIILTRSDPYVPLVQAEPAIAAIQGNGNFTDEAMSQINHQNALTVFPLIANALKLKG